MISIRESAKLRWMIRWMGKWFFVPFVWGIFQLSPHLKDRGFWIYTWLVVYLVYLVILELLSRTWRKSYETPVFRMIRIQAMMFLASALLSVTGGAESYFWFLYLWSLFATASYFTWVVTCGVYSEVAVLYFLSSVIAVGGLAPINMVLLLINQIILFLLTATFQHLRTTESELTYFGILEQTQQDVDTAIDLQDVLNKILEQAARAVGARDGTLMLLDETGKLRFRARLRGPAPEVESERTFKPGEGVAGWVMQNCRPYICYDARTDDHFIPIMSGSPPIRSSVSVPIVSHGTVLGVINVDHPEAKHFSRADAKLLVTLASQTAAAIERAELLESLRQIGKKTLGSAEDLNEDIVDAVHRLTRCPVAMWQVDEKIRTQATIRAHRGLREEYVRERVLDLRHSVTGRAIRTAEPIKVVDIEEDQRVSPETKVEARQQGWKSMLVVPLSAGLRRVVGTLSIYSLARREFTSWEIDLLSTFASQAGVALQNAERLHSRIRDLEIINDTVKIISTKLDTADLLNTIVSQVADGLNCTHCTLFFAQEENGERLLVPQVTHGLFSDQIMERHFKSGEGVAGWVFQHGESVVLDDAKGDPRFLPAIVERDKPRSMLVVPVKVGDQTTGVISADQDEYGWFRESDLRLMDALARHIGIAIERAVGLELLKDIGNRIIIAQEVDEILQQIISGAIKLTNTNTGVIYLISEDGQSVVKSFHPSGFEHPPPRLDKKKTLTRYVMETGEVVSIPDTNKDPRVNPVLLDHFRSMVAVPLKIEQKVIGVLYLNDEDKHEFTETEISLLLTLASQAASTIHNAQLHEQLRLREKQRAALQRLVGLNDLAGRFVHRVGNLAGTIPLDIEFVQDELQSEAPDYRAVSQELEEIKIQARQLLEMTSRILKSTQKLKDSSDSRFLQKVKAADLLDKAVIQVRSMEQKTSPWSDRIVVNKIYTDSPLVIETFESLFTEALVNLISNAVEAMPEGGTLTLGAECRQVNDVEYAVLTVVDTGIGIPADDLPRIYDIDYTRKPGGFGYGLWLVRHICDATGTEIQVESTEGVGTTFHLFVPFAEDEGME